jgi:GNAT superfamily N-acetyltransferase
MTEARQRIPLPALLRHAGNADARTLARLHVTCWRQTYPGIIPRSHLDALSIEEETEGWHRALRRGDIVFVAERQGEPVGFASAGIARHARSEMGELYTLYVLREHQGAGVGRALFDACHFELAQRRLPGLMVWVLAANPARGFYRRLGGQQAGRSTFSVGNTRLDAVGFAWPG